MTDKLYRADIDVLRAISVIAVVVFHAFPGVLKGGYLGVDVFFVISGFLITRNIVWSVEDGSFTFINFYRRRIQRILPPLLLVLFAAILLGALFLYPSEYKQLGKHVFLSSFFVLNFGLMNEVGYFDVESHFKPLLHLWSLSVEEQFYLVWPVVLLLLHKAKLSLRYSILILSTISLGGYIHYVKYYPDEVFFNSLTRFWQIGFGGFLGLQSGKARFMRSLKNSSIAFPSSLLILAVSFVVFEKGSMYGLGAITSVIGGLLFITSERDVLSKRALVYLGKISYSLYLWHWLFISFAIIYTSKTFHNTAVLAAIGLSLVMAVLTYHSVEKIRNWRSPKTSGILLAIICVTAVAGMVIRSNEGFKNRPHLIASEIYLKDFERTPAKDPECLEYIEQYLNEPEEFHYCRANLSSKDRPILAILGDSHGHASFPGVADIAARHGYDTVLLGSSSCPPLKGFLENKNSKMDKSCLIQISQRLQVISEDTRIERILMVTRGPVYVTGEVEKPFTQETVSADKLKQDGAEKKYLEFAKGLRTTISELSELSHVKNIYVMTENPELDFVPKDVLPRPFDRFGISIEESRGSRLLYEQRMLNYRQAVEGVIPDFPKSHLVDVTPYFCDDEHCFSYRDGRFLYADDDHFSVYGSEYLALKIESVLFEP